MALTRLQWRSFMDASTSIFSSSKHSSLFAKPRYSTLWSNPGIRNSETCLKQSPVEHMTGEVARRVTTHQCKLKNIISEYRTRSLSILGFSKSPLSSYNVFAVRMFSALTKSGLTCRSTGESVSSRNGSKPFVFNKHRKQGKSFSNQDSIKGKSNDSQVSAHGNVSTVNSSDVGIKTGIKEKQRSQNRKKKQKTPDSQISSKNASEKSSNSKGVSPRVSEIKSTGPIVSSGKIDSKVGLKTGIKQKQRSRNMKKKEKPPDSQLSSKNASEKSSNSKGVSPRVSEVKSTGPIVSSGKIDSEVGLKTGIKQKQSSRNRKKKAKRPVSQLSPKNVSEKSSNSKGVSPRVSELKSTGPIVSSGKIDSEVGLKTGIKQKQSSQTRKKKAKRPVSQLSPINVSEKSSNSKGVSPRVSEVKSTGIDSEVGLKTGIKQKRSSRNRKKKAKPTVSQLSPKNVSEKSSNSKVVSPRGSEVKSTGPIVSSGTVDCKVGLKIGIKQKQRSRNWKKKEKPPESQLSPKNVSEKSSTSQNSSTGNMIKEKATVAKKKVLKSQQTNPTIVNKFKSITLTPLYPPRGKSVVVVESETKAKIIQGYLGDMYKVIPSYGHVRSLAATSRSVLPDDDFSMVWEVPPPAWVHLKSMKDAMSGAHNLILALEPDREGEAIAWHIYEMLQQQGALNKDTTVARVTFKEITELAIKNGLQTPRDLDVNLVHAYLARRALDYLINLKVSPLIWKKLPGCQSAGRVQSAALALLCDREKEIEEFKPCENWSIEATFFTSKGNSCCVRSNLTSLGSSKLNRLSETTAKRIEKAMGASNFKVTGSAWEGVVKVPPTPYVTSMLQQDAAVRLNFTAAYTMKLAQKLYEGVEFSDGKAAGLITYMRTDGLHISNEAAMEICSFITERYGADYVSKVPRNIFIKKPKNVQEAHEAIRPTDIRRLPSMLVGVIDDDSLKLYTLIWARTMACQMEVAEDDKIYVDIGNYDGSISLRATCSNVSIPGFNLFYEDEETKVISDTDMDIESSGRKEVYEILRSLKEREQLELGIIELKKNYTQPPTRYSEASLVGKLEKLGIGRPSTYASTIKVLQERKYVTVENGVLTPEFRGRMVSAFLSHFFAEVTGYSFTAGVETELDNVSGGFTDWKGLLKGYWSRFSSYCEHVDKVGIRQVEEMLERTFGNFLFSSLPDEDRTCPSCLEGTLIFKVSRFGAGYYIGCDRHPNCKYIAKTLYGEEEEEENEDADKNKSIEEPVLLGIHPTSGEKVLLKVGPYGTYVQLGQDRVGHSPKRAPVQIKDKDKKSITLEDALELLRYPLTLGKHPVDGLPVVIRIAKVGFSIKHRRNIAPVPKNFPPNKITMKKAIEFLSGPEVRRLGRPFGKSRFLEEDEDFDD